MGCPRGRIHSCVTLCVTHNHRRVVCGAPGAPWLTIFLQGCIFLADLIPSSHFSSIRNTGCPKHFNSCFSHYSTLVSIIPLAIKVERFSYFLDKVVKLLYVDEPHLLSFTERLIPSTKHKPLMKQAGRTRGH